MVYESTLYHHGIKGQKWGVRRFQHPDGTLTSKGKKRYSEDGAVPRKDYSDTGKKIAKGLAIGAAVGLSAYVLMTPQGRKMVEKMASTTVSGLMKAKSATGPALERTKQYVNSTLLGELGPKAASGLKNAASKMAANAASNQKAKELAQKAGKGIVTGLTASGKRVGNAMVDAALLSVGGIAISKLAKKLETPDDAEESVKNKNKVILDTATAGINALTKANSSNKSNNNNSGNKNGGTVGEDVSKAVGAPSKKGNAKQDPQYNALFKDSSGNQRSEDARSTIKSMASAGYDVDQISEYLKLLDSGAIKHSFYDIVDELNYYRAMLLVDAILT